MDYTNKDFLERRPQRLCKMCGKCCRVVVASVEHNELVKNAKNGDKSSKEFLELFEPYKSVEDAMAVDESIVKNIPDYQNQTFYKCRFLQDDNLCSRYKDRLDVCRIFPSSPWCITPPNCGFEGWLFQEQEAHKKRVRKLKEEQIFYRAKLKTDIPKKEKQLYEKLIKKIDERINLFEKYGAKYW
ncbi:MAG: YkgJ family cysteine cluster protein [Candidatus Gastranaerophilales bacterium]|nr:YkgJ family cysteine cluster protein [Candidatus Gastranaerophilales bacterium]